MIEYIHLQRSTATPRHWRRLWRRGCRVEVRSVPTDYRPFAVAHHWSVKAQSAARAVAPLIDLPPERIQELIEQAVWDAAGEAETYLAARHDSWEQYRIADVLDESSRVYGTTVAAGRALSEHADALDVECTEDCDRIRDVCRDIAQLRDTLRAEDRVREALRKGDRRGAYSARLPAITLDLTDRVTGLSDGLRRMQAVA